MNTNILQDLAWQSEAYYKGGLQALNVIYAGETNALDLPTINGWREIDDGVQNNIASEIQNGNLQLAHREQFTILKPNYDTLNAMGSGITSLMSIQARAIEGWKEPKDRKTSQNNWGFRLTVPDGGLIEENDEFPFEAPDTGYQSVMEWHFRDGDSDWKGFLKKKILH